MINGGIKAEKARKVRKITGFITNAGAAVIAAGAGFTAVRNGAGDVTITLTRPGKTFLGAGVLAIHPTAATSHSAKLIAAPTATAIRIGTYVADGVDGAPADLDFCFEITVKDAT